MSTCITFTFHSDPGHAWLQVETSLIKSLNVTGISSCSYVDGAANLIAFLEEDCDAALFIRENTNLFLYDITVEQWLYWNDNHWYLCRWRDYKFGKSPTLFKCLSITITINDR